MGKDTDTNHSAHTRSTHTHTHSLSLSLSLSLSCTCTHAHIHLHAHTLTHASAHAHRATHTRTHTPHLCISFTHRCLPMSKSISTNRPGGQQNALPHYIALLKSSRHNGPLQSTNPSPSCLCYNRKYTLIILAHKQRTYR